MRLWECFPRCLEQHVIHRLLIKLIISCRAKDEVHIDERHRCLQKNLFTHEELTPDVCSPI